MPVACLAVPSIFLTILLVARGARISRDVYRNETDADVSMHEAESAFTLSNKCGAAEPAHKMPLHPQNATSDDVLVTQSFLEASEVATLVFGFNDSLASLGNRDIDYECTMAEWHQFSDRFSLAMHEGYNCKQLEHSDFEDGEICSEKNVLYFYPWDDHNGAFCVNPNVCHRMNSWYSHACSVHMRRQPDVDNAIKELDLFPDHSLKHAVLGGHGDGTSIHWGEGSKCGRSHLCTNDKMSEQFFMKLSRKMHRHGSIFLDSCLSSTTDPRNMLGGENLGSWVAKTVGKGIRVIGSVLSFGKVRVTRFIAWHGQIDVGGASDVQRVHVAPGAHCPSWAKDSYPDSEGDCSCPDAYIPEVQDPRWGAVSTSRGPIF
mmetsp:Transcript_97799/g.218887  ORF Transcript_97799/g.218887 Transcript_97799/m.218887 type:complete len:374 (+) Transcript_97799:59-1180(+)